MRGLLSIVGCAFLIAIAEPVRGEQTITISDPGQLDPFVGHGEIASSGGAFGVISGFGLTCCSVFEHFHGFGRLRLVYEYRESGRMAAEAQERWFGFVPNSGEHGISFQQFDDAGGARQLQSVSLTLWWQLSAFAWFENSQTIPSESAFWQAQGTIGWGLGALDIAFAVSGQGSILPPGLAPNDGVPGSGPDYHDFGHVFAGDELSDIGGCCLGGSACVVDAIENCHAAGGIYLGEFISCGLSACPVTAYGWSEPGGGAFHDALNWMPQGVPGPGAAARFDLEDAYTIGFGGDQVSERAAFGAGAVAFDLTGGHEYALEGSGALSLAVADVPGQPASLAISGGTVGGGGARIGDAAGAAGTVIVDGRNSMLVMIENLCVGCAGPGELIVTNGATAISRDAIVGALPGSFGSLAHISGAGSSWQIPLFLAIDNGTVLVEDGGEVAVGFGIFLFESGAIGGDGTISGDVVNFGVVAPGASAGRLVIDGAYEQLGVVPVLGEGSGTLALELGGTVPELEHDVLEVHGPVVLGGGLLVSLIGEFTPQLGQQFEMVQASGMIEGAFDVALLPGLGGNRYMRLSYPPALQAGAGASVVAIEVDELSNLVSFGGPSATGVAGAATAAVVADLNGDGQLDLAVTVNGQEPADNGSVIILINDGTGRGFAQQQIVTVQRSPAGIAAGRFDGDGAIDLAVANAGDDTVSVLMNDGGGEFAIGSTVPVGQEPRAIAAGNMHDESGEQPGAIDLVVANTAGGTIQLLLNDGRGGFAPLMASPTTDDPISVRPEDVDDDKCLDSIIVTGPGGGLVALHPLLGGGAVGAAINVAVGAQPLALAAPVPAGEPLQPLDLNADGLTDLATANGSGTVSVLLGEPDGTYTPAVNLPVGDVVSSMAALDMDGDGDLDLALVVESEGTRTVRLMRNDLESGQLAFALEDVDGAPTGALLVLGGDMDGDGATDLVTLGPAANGGGVAGAGAPAFSDITVLPNLPPGDTDGDGDVDINDLIAVLVGWGPCPPPGACPGDVNGDGAVDIDDLVTVVVSWG